MRFKRPSNYALHQALAGMLLVGSCAFATSEMPVLKELADLHAQTGLTVVYVGNGRVSEVSFVARTFKLVEQFRPELSVRFGQFSLDGSKIAFPYRKVRDKAPGDHEGRSIANGGEVLGIMSSNGSELQTYGNIHNPQNFCWSPNQGFLALTGSPVEKNQPGRRSGLLVLAPGSGTVQPIAHGGLANSPCWSPDGSTFVYEKQGEIYVWSLNDKKSQHIASGQWPTWCPEEHSIAFYKDGSYYAFDPGTGISKRLFTAKNAFSPLWWSPDARFVAYVSRAKFLESASASAYPDEVRLRIRRMTDGREDWAVRFSGIGPWQDFQWLAKFSQGTRTSQP